MYKRPIILAFHLSEFDKALPVYLKRIIPPLDRCGKRYINCLIYIR